MSQQHNEHYSYIRVTVNVPILEAFVHDMAMYLSVAGGRSIAGHYRSHHHNCEFIPRDCPFVITVLIVDTARIHVRCVDL
jgi:hypothetical protein